MPNKLYLFRPNPAKVPRINEFLENNLVGAGWSKTGNLSNKSKDEIRELLISNYHYIGNQIINPLSSLLLIKETIKEGDWLLVPDEECIHTAQVVGGYEFNKDAVEGDFAHQRKVKWGKELQREELPEAVRKSLRYIGTVANLSKHMYVMAPLLVDHVPILASKNNELMTADFEIRPGLTVPVVTPRDMSEKEATRLGEFIKLRIFD